MNDRERLEMIDAVLDELSERMKVGGEIKRRRIYSFAFFSFAFAEKLLIPF